MTDIEKLAMSRTLDGNLTNRQRIIEEMVDVMICMDVIRVGLEITDAELIDMRHHKMKRNLQRIGG